MLVTFSKKFRFRWILTQNLGFNIQGTYFWHQNFKKNKPAYRSNTRKHVRKFEIITCSTRKMDSRFGKPPLTSWWNSWNILEKKNEAYSAFKLGKKLWIKRKWSSLALPISSWEMRINDQVLSFLKSLRELVGEVLVLVPKLSPNHMLLVIKWLQLPLVKPKVNLTQRTLSHKVKLYCF